MKSTNLLFKKAVIVPMVFFTLSGFSQSFLKAVSAIEIGSSTPGEFAKAGKEGYSDTLALFTPTSIEFVRADEELLVFEVNLGQIPEKGCMLTIYEGSGETLFQKRINSPSFRQIFKIAKSNLDQVNFEARGKNFLVKESFYLQFRVEEKVEVIKL